MKEKIFFMLVFAALVLLVGCTGTTQKNLERQISEQIDSMNYCDGNEECVVKGFGCPFGCYSLVNKDANLEAVEEMLVKYNGMGLGCRYACGELPELVFCLEGRCIVPEEIPEITYCEEDEECKVVYKGTDNCCPRCEPIAINKEKEEQYNSYYEEYSDGKFCGKMACEPCDSLKKYEAKCYKEMNSCYYE
ncbi:MAG: hypothetical protein ABIE23_05585 [archaeon]